MKTSGWRSGQVILVMSITLVTIILLVSTVIYLTSTQHLFFNYNPSREIVMSIDSDFNRVLTRILANATATYNMTSEMDFPRRVANLTFSYWVVSTQAAYTGKGLNIRTKWVDEPVQEAKSITLTVYGLDHQGYPSNPSDRVFNYAERKLQDRLFKLFWYRPNSISAIGAEISVDANFQGVVGWRTTHIVLLNLTITSIIPYEKDNYVELYVTVLRENGVPVNDLRKENFEVYLFDPTVPPGVYCWKRVSPNSMILTYNGGGSYTIRVVPSFHDPLSDRARLFWRWEPQQGNQPHQPGYYQFFLVRVQDNRGIIVEAYSYSGIEYAIQENAVEPFYTGDPSKVKETYVFELIANGTMYWYNTKLSSPTNNPPIPLPPVKQVRVMATRNWPSDPTFEEVPYQTEVWDDRYLWPNSEHFLDWRRRIMNGSKIVFELNYPPGCRLQKVRLTWFEDADATPPDYRLNMTLSAGLATVNNGKYVLTLVASPTSHWVDWSISLLDPRSGTHVEYVLLGYDVYNMPGGGWWFPRKVPADDWTILPTPVNESNVFVARAPVRLVAFRKSNRTQERPPEGPVSNDEMYYENLLYIPYNVSYFLYVANATWLRSVRMDIAYMSLMGMIGGTDADAGSPLRVQWGSFATSVANPSIVNGTYSNRANIMHRDRNNVNPSNVPSPQSYGNWTVVYNEYAGMAIFASEEFIDELRSYFINNVRRDQLWVWTTYDFQRRVMEYDAIYWRMGATSEVYNTDPANRIQFKVAGFLTEGARAANIFYNASLWRNFTGSRVDPNALPFATVESTSGTVAGDIELTKRNAFIYDDFSTDPFSGRLVANTGAWSWNPAGYVQVSADGPSGSWGGAHVAYFVNNTPPGANTVYVLSRELFVFSYPNQRAGLAMIGSDNAFYTLDAFRLTPNPPQAGNRRLGAWRYDGSWYQIRQSSNIAGLTDNTWLIFLGSRNVNTGAMALTVFNSAGTQTIGSLTCTDTSLSINRIGLSIYDPTMGSGPVAAGFDDFVACADANPRFVNITGLTPGWTVVLKDENGATVASANANTRGVASLNVITKPIVRNARIEIYSGATLIASKSFDIVVGGDVYRRTVVENVKNAVEECLMYYRMFLNQFAPSIVSVVPVY
ncbi:MAG: hypothetical protein QXU11_03790 [Thermoproteota archaeon]